MGVTPVPGLFVLGMNFQRCRNSAYIDGVGADAAELGELIWQRLNAKDLLLAKAGHGR
jgi:putative flavoprotein involved in K+ transport